MIKKTYDIGIIGDICSVGVNMAKSLSELGAKVIVFNKPLGNGCETIDNYYTKNENAFETFTYKNSMDFFKKACSCRIIFSFTGSILGPLKNIYPLRFLPIFPPIVNIATGSDLIEFIAEKNIKAFLFRMHLKLSTINWIVEYPLSLKNIQKYKIPNIYFMPFPAFRLPKNKLPLPKQSAKIIFFHPSRLDWKVSDSSPNRKSSKGNDRFIKAFIRAVKDGLNAQCILLDRGPDKDIAKELIHKSGVQDRFIWKNSLSRDELFKEFKNCHVVVDQFDAGGLGGIAIEAMASGRPIMTYVEENCSKLQYGGDLPPVINAWSEDQIYAQIMNCNDPSFISTKAEAAYLWAFRQHRTEVAYDKILFYVFLLTGRQIRDYGWSKDAYSVKS